MPFEYDPAKSVTNKAKHGIDFDEAQVLWKDARMLEAPAKTDDEPRCRLNGRITHRDRSRCPFDDIFPVKPRVEGRLV